MELKQLFTVNPTKGIASHAGRRNFIGKCSFGSNLVEQQSECSSGDEGKR
jgi:hypothetical protein